MNQQIEDNKVLTQYKDIEKSDMNIRQKQQIQTK